MNMPFVKQDKVFAVSLVTFVVSYMRKRTFLVLVVLLSVISGCQGAVPSGQSKNSGTLSSASVDSVGCTGASVSYWGLENHNRTQTWSSDTLRLGYGLPANASVFFVAYENGTVLGVTHVTTNETVAADGDTFPLNTQLSGMHTINVKLYEDTNGNGNFDPKADTVCRNNGTVIETGTRPLNFSRFDSDSNSSSEA